jgi:large subunit ribosomal protein L10
MNSDKKIIIDALQERINTSPYVIVIDYTGMTVPQFTELRSRLNAAGSSCQVSKNSYLRQAMAEAGLPDVSESLIGQTAYITGSSEVFAAAKVISNFTKEFKKPTMKIGVLDGVILDEAKLTAISSIVSRESVLSQLLGTINEPATRIARLIEKKFNPEGSSVAE